MKNGIVRRYIATFTPCETGYEVRIIEGHFLKHGRKQTRIATGNEKDDHDCTDAWGYLNHVHMCEIPGKSSAQAAVELLIVKTHRRVLQHAEQLKKHQEKLATLVKFVRANQDECNIRTYPVQKDS